MRIAIDAKVLAVSLLAMPLLLGSSFKAQATEIPPPSTPAALAAAAPGAGDPPGKAGDKTGLDAAEKKLPDSVKDVLKRLDKPTEDVTLDDLNSARQAVAKVEIIIELEKRLAELDKIRHERDKETFTPMIPASALQMPTNMPAAALAPSPMPMQMMPREMEVTQISGGSGHYSAMIKVGTEEAKTYRVGDHLSDGSDVVEILPTQVVLEAHGGTKRTLHVKNVDMVFGNSF